MGREPAARPVPIRTVQAHGTYDLVHGPVEDDADERPFPRDSESTVNQVACFFSSASTHRESLSSTHIAEGTVHPISARLSTHNLIGYT